MPAIRVGRPQAAEIDAVLALVEGARLPLDGIRDDLDSFLVARSNGRLVGVVGLELYGSSALLRSLVVEPGERRRGIAGRLCRAALRRARLLGAEELFLLTTDAAAFFRTQGFADCDRSRVPSLVASSWQFTSGACVTAACLSRTTREAEAPSDLALQDAYPGNHCFGCGPHNESGLRLRSFWTGDECVARFRPSPEHNAGPRVWLNGGIIATVIDCHSIFTALAAGYERAGRPFASEPRLWSVTGSLSVRYRRPTPIDQEVGLVAWVRDSQGKRTTVDCVLFSGGRACASAEVVAVSVDEAWRSGGAGLATP